MKIINQIEFVIANIKRCLNLAGGIIIHIRELADHKAKDNARSVAVPEARQQEAGEGLL